MQTAAATTVWRRVSMAMPINRLGGEQTAIPYGDPTSAPIVGSPPCFPLAWRRRGGDSVSLSRNGFSMPAAFSEAEAKASRGSDRVAIEEAVRQAAIDL